LLVGYLSPVSYNITTPYLTASGHIEVKSRMAAELSGKVTEYWREKGGEGKQRRPLFGWMGELLPSPTIPSSRHVASCPGKPGRMPKPENCKCRSGGEKCQVNLEVARANAEAARFYRFQKSLDELKFHAAGARGEAARNVVRLTGLCSGDVHLTWIII
jgi:hypothetical protein